VAATALPATGPPTLTTARTAADTAPPTLADRETMGAALGPPVPPKTPQRSKLLSVVSVLALALLPAIAGTDQIPGVTFDASSVLDAHSHPRNAHDGNWRSRWESQQEREGAWIQLKFPSALSLGAVVLVDQANEKGLIHAVRLSFSDGTGVDYLFPVSQDPGIPQNGLLWNPIDADAASRPDKGAHFIRFGKPVKTSWIRVTLTQTDPTSKASAGLAEIRPVQVPERDVQPLASVEEQETLLESAYALKRGSPPVDWHFANDEFSVEISKDTGLVTAMTSLRPAPLVVTGGNHEAAVLYVRNIDRGWEDRFTVLKAWYEGSGREEGVDYRELVCVVAPAEYPVMFAQIRYRFFPDRMDQRIRFHYLVDDWCRYRLGFFQDTQLADWPEYRDTGWSFAPSAAKSIKLFTHAYDICWEQGDWGNAAFPMGVLKRDDRLLMVGSFDLGPHIVLSPNLPVEGAVPSVFIMPFGLARGRDYTFDLFFKSFSRDREDYVEALRWYASRTHFHHPELKGIPVRLTQKTSRTIPAGRFVHSPFPGFAGDTPAKLAELRRWMHKTKATNLLYGDWDGWVHSPEEFEGATWSGYHTIWGGLSTRQLADSIAELKADGFRVFLYINNFKNPPFQKRGMIDVGDPLVREWYLKRVQEAIRLMRPSGIFWDCGWWPLHYASPNDNLSSDPRGDTLKGWVILQARLYHWLKENHPDMHVAMNLMSGGSPSQYFTDAIMSEGHGVAHPQNLEDSKALMTACISYFSVFYYDVLPPTLKKHGLTFADTIEAGISDEIKADLWNDFMRSGLRSVGLGGALSGSAITLVEHTPERRRAYPEYNGYAFHFPVSRQIPELDTFCAEALAVPLVPSSFAVVTRHPNVYGSAWAAHDRLLVAIHNSSGETRQLDAQINLAILREFGLDDPGELQTQILDPRGVLIPGKTFTLENQGRTLRMAGELGVNELALIQTRATASR
jgi:hypothetical protein